MAFYSYLSTKIIIMTFITKSYQNLFGVRSYINAFLRMHAHRHHRHPEHWQQKQVRQKKR